MLEVGFEYVCEKEGLVLQKVQVKSYILPMTKG